MIWVKKKAELKLSSVIIILYQGRYGCPKEDSLRGWALNRNCLSLSGSLL